VIVLFWSVWVGWEFWLETGWYYGGGVYGGALVG